MTIIVTSKKEYRVDETWHESVSLINGVRDGVYDANGPMVTFHVRKTPVLVHVDDIKAVEYE